MTIDEYMRELDLIQHRLLSMPEDEALKESFTQEQKKLEELISLLPKFTLEEQTNARHMLNDFADTLGLKLAQLKARLETLSQTMQYQEIRQKSIKAYGDRQKIL